MRRSVARPATDPCPDPDASRSWDLARPSMPSNLAPRKTVCHLPGYFSKCNPRSSKVISILMAPLPAQYLAVIPRLEDVGAPNRTAGSIPCLLRPKSRPPACSNAWEVSRTSGHFIPCQNKQSTLAVPHPRCCVTSHHDQKLPPVLSSPLLTPFQNFPYQFPRPLYS